MRRLRPCFLSALALLLAFAPARPASAQASIGEPIEVEEEVPAEPAPKPKAKPKEEKKPENKPEGVVEAKPSDVKPAEPKAAEAKPTDAKPAETKAAEAKPAEAKPAEVKPTEPKAAPVNEMGAAVASVARSVLMPSATEGSIVEHWRKRLEYLSERDEKRVEEQEREIERIRDELQFDNLYGVSTALVREADELVKKGSAQEAVRRCEAAVRLAPHFYLAHLCLARARFAADPLGAGKAIGSAVDALGVTFEDVRSRRNAVSDELLILLFALVIAAAVLVSLLIARYLGLFFHDFHHVFPKGASRWQTALIAAILLAMPAFLGLGIVGSVALSAIAIGVFLSRGETIAIGAAFALLGAAQLVMGPVVQSGAFGLVANDVYLLERGDAPMASVARLQQRVDAGLGDYTTAFALGRYYKRVARLPEAEAAYNVALKFQRTSEVLNNLGNVRFLAGDSAGAQKFYRDANSANASVAAPLYNISKMYFREGKLELGQQAQKAAVEIGGEQVSARLGVNDDVRANVYVIDAALTDDQILALAEREAQAVSRLGGRAVQLLIGRSSHVVAALIALLAGIFVAVAHAGQQRLRPSSRCEKCGRPVCVRCDPELAGPGAMCGQCISVFVRRTGVDAPDRIRKEIEVRRFRRRQKLIVRALGLVIGGGGHVFSGRVVGGAVFLLVFCLPAAQVLFWQGVLRAPVVADLSPSAARIALYAIVLLATYAFSVRHLLKHEELD